MEPTGSARAPAARVRSRVWTGRGRRGPGAQQVGVWSLLRGAVPLWPGCAAIEAWSPPAWLPVLRPRCAPFSARCPPSEDRALRRARPRASRWRRLPRLSRSVGGRPHGSDARERVLRCGVAPSAAACGCLILASTSSNMAFHSLALARRAATRAHRWLAAQPVPCACSMRAGVQGPYYWPSPAWPRGLYDRPADPRTSASRGSGDKVPGDGLHPWWCARSTIGRWLRQPLARGLHGEGSSRTAGSGVRRDATSCT